MCDHEGARVIFLDFVNRFSGKFDVDVAGAFPEVHLATSLLDDPLTEVGIRDEEDRTVGGRLFDDEGGIAGGTDNIAESFDASGTVDVGDDVVVLVGVFLEVSFELIGWAGLLKGATSVFIGENDGFLSGLRILAVSAMKWTPQKAITSASVSRAW